MQKHQKIMIAKLIAVIVVTIAMTFTMIVFKDKINRSEAMLAMEHLSKNIQKYRSDYGQIPPESYIASIRDSLPGKARLGGIFYRAHWIDSNSPSDSVLAYTAKFYRTPFVPQGYVVLRLDGRVEWMNRADFEKILASQQSDVEKEIPYEPI